MNSRFFLSLAAVLSTTFVACKEKPAPRPSGAAPSARAPSVSALRPEASPRASGPSAPQRAAEERVVRETPSKNGKLSGLELGQAHDIAPAAAAVATTEGVVLLTKTAEVVLVRHAELARPLTATRPETDFAAMARVPAVADGFVYFVRAGKLLRRAIAGGDLEELAGDAQNGSRVSALAGGGSEGPVVAYLTRQNAEGASQAKLWSPRRVLTLTPEGAGASSVSLVRTDKTTLAVSIDGRSAMTPVHARPVRFQAAGPALGDDSVVWVGGSAQPQTEVVAASDGAAPWAFLAIEKDVSHFGLAELALDPEGRMEAEASWRLYPNGIDLAPVAAARVCRRLLLVFVRPVESRPHAPQELVLSFAGSSEAVVAASARGFAGATVAETEKGGVIAYVADARTWALPIGCR